MSAQQWNPPEGWGQHERICDFCANNFDNCCNQNPEKGYGCTACRQQQDRDPAHRCKTTTHPALHPGPRSRAEASQYGMRHQCDACFALRRPNCSWMVSDVAQAFPCNYCIQSGTVCTRENVPIDPQGAGPAASAPVPTPAPAVAFPPPVPEGIQGHFVGNVIQTQTPAPSISPFANPINLIDPTLLANTGFYQPQPVLPAARPSTALTVAAPWTPARPAPATRRGQFDPRTIVHRPVPEALPAFTRRDVKAQESCRVCVIKSSRRCEASEWGHSCAKCLQWGLPCIMSDGTVMTGDPSYAGSGQVIVQLQYPVCEYCREHNRQCDRLSPCYECHTNGQACSRPGFRVPNVLDRAKVMQHKLLRSDEDWELFYLAQGLGYANGRPIVRPPNSERLPGLPFPLTDESILYPVEMGRRVPGEPFYPFLRRTAPGAVVRATTANAVAGHVFPGGAPIPIQLAPGGPHASAVVGAGPAPQEAAREARIQELRSAFSNFCKFLGSEKMKGKIDTSREPHNGEPALDRMLRWMALWNRRREQRQQSLEWALRLDVAPTLNGGQDMLADILLQKAFDSCLLFLQSLGAATIADSLYTNIRHQSLVDGLATMAGFCRTQTLLPVLVATGELPPQNPDLGQPIGNGAALLAPVDGLVDPNLANMVFGAPAPALQVPNAPAPPNGDGDGMVLDGDDQHADQADDVQPMDLVLRDAAPPIEAPSVHPLLRFRSDRRRAVNTPIDRLPDQPWLTGPLGRIWLPTASDPIDFDPQQPHEGPINPEVLGHVTYPGNIIPLLSVPNPPNHMHVRNELHDQQCVELVLNPLHGANGEPEFIQCQNHADALSNTCTHCVDLAHHTNNPHVLCDFCTQDGRRLLTASGHSLTEAEVLSARAHLCESCIGHGWSVAQIFSGSGFGVWGYSEGVANPDGTAIATPTVEVNGVSFGGFRGPVQPIVGCGCWKLIGGNLCHGHRTRHAREWLQHVKRMDAWAMQTFGGRVCPVCRAKPGIDAQNFETGWPLVSYVCLGCQEFVCLQRGEANRVQALLAGWPASGI